MSPPIDATIDDVAGEKKVNRSLVEDNALPHQDILQDTNYVERVLDFVINHSRHSYLARPHGKLLCLDYRHR